MFVCYLCLQKNALAFKEIDSGRRDRRMVVTGRGKADFRRPPVEGTIKRIEGIKPVKDYFICPILVFRAVS